DIGRSLLRDDLLHRRLGHRFFRRGFLRGSLLRRELLRHGLLRRRSLLHRNGLLRNRLFRRRDLLHGRLFRSGRLRRRLLRQRLPGGRSLLRSRLAHGLAGGWLGLGCLGGLLRGFFHCHERRFLLIPLRRESALLYPDRTTAATAQACAGPCPCIVIARFLILLLRGYKRWLSPLLGPRCRFLPTCSEYAMIAI